MKPRVFISAVSGEFASLRKQASDTLHRIGYEPVVQEQFDTLAGDLRAALREKIDA